MLSLIILSGGNIMKKKNTYIVTVTLLIALFVLVYVWSFDIYKKRTVTKSNISTTSSSKEVINQPVASNNGEESPSAKKEETQTPAPPYYATIKENRVQIFYNDKTTLFEDTAILTDLLSKEYIASLEKGISFSTAEELYGYLEGLTS